MNRPSSSSMSSEKSDSSLLKSNNLNKNYIHKDDEENLSNVSNMHNNKNVNKDGKLICLFIYIYSINNDILLKN